MKIARIIGLAAIAALAITGLAGASSAMAAETVLCKVSGEECSSLNRYGSGTSLKASSSNATFEMSYGLHVNCAESVLEGKTTAASGEPLPGEFSSWTLAGCTDNEHGECTAKSEHLPASATIAHGSGSNGSLSLTGSGGAVGWRLTCPEIGIECKYSFNPSLSIEGGSPAHLSATKVAMKGVNFCAPSTTFTATYTVTSPQPLYVAAPLAPGTVLCKANESSCAFSNQYPSGTQFAAEEASGTKFEIHMSPENYTCTNSSFAGETTSRTGEGGVPASISALSLSKCEFTNGNSCINEGWPSTAKFVNGTEGNSEKRLEVANLSLRLLCPASGFDCTFYASTGWFTITPGAPATLSINETVSKKGLGCPSSATFKATYSVTSPSPLYLSWAE